MAVKRTVGKLFVRLNSDTKGLEKGFSRASSKTNAFAKKLKVGLAAASTAMLTFGTAAAVATKKFINSADSIAKGARAAGLSNEAFQLLRKQFDLAGVSTSTFDQSMLALNKRVGEAKNGTGALVTFLNKYDTTLLKNIQSSKSQEQVINLLANAMENESDGAKRAALASAAFSRAGLKMELALRGGASAIEEANKKLKEMGIVIGDDVLDKAEDLKDELTLLDQVVETKLTEAFITLGPLLVDVSKALAVLAKDATDTYKILKSIFVLSSAEEAHKNTTDAINELDRLQKKKADVLGRSGLTGEAYNRAAAAWDKRIELARTKARSLLKIETDLAGMSGESKPEPKPKPLQEPEPKPEPKPDPTPKVEPTVYDEINSQLETNVVRTNQAYQASFQFQKALSEGKITAEEFDFAMKSIGKTLGVEHVAAIQKTLSPMEQLQERWLNTTEAMEYAAVTAFENSADALTEFVMGGKLNMKDFANSIIRDLLKIQIKALAIKSLTGLGFSVGGDLEAKARGGNVRGSQSYIVGEKGPEIFTPKSHGHITPNSKMRDYMSDNLPDKARGGKLNMKDLANSVIQDLLKIQIKALDVKSLTGLGFSVGEGAGDLPHKARGGNVRGSQSYVVGEKGPEIFTPKSHGHITPNSKIGGGPTKIEVNMTNNGTPQQAEDVSYVQQNDKLIVNVITNDYRRGREFRRMMDQNYVRKQ